MPDSTPSGLPGVHLSRPVPPPRWALLQRRLLDTMGRAAVEFTGRYTRPDGSLIWRAEWPGMDGSDDGYESFYNFPLLAALTGDASVDALARREWEAVTTQFTGYGQIHREFDAYYDWMHHGESSLLFYFFGLTDPGDLRMIGRARRFAGMYMGDDPEADNYDRERRQMRSPITGSRGPRFENSAEDWVTHRPILADYPPPFEDIPGCVDGKANWNDDAIFAEILQRMNERMMRCDIPLNLTATSLMTHAFLLTGEERYRDWVLEYTSAWMDRAQQNGGLLPDNVGPSGVTGETMGSRWWGGYYGWQWPHGWMNLIQPAVIAASNALLLTGDRSWLDFPRTQLDRMREHGRLVDGRLQTPHRHGCQGWYDYRPPDLTPLVYLWFLSGEQADLDRLDDWRQGSGSGEVRPGRGKGDDIHAMPWMEFISGGLDGYPDAILDVNHHEMLRRLELIRGDDGDPEEWDVHHWQDRNPVVLEGCVQLILGGPKPIYHGGLLHSRVRPFDLRTRRPGLPPSAALGVDQVTGDGIELEVFNLDPLEDCTLLIQAGAFAEHLFTGIEVVGGDSAAGNMIGSISEGHVQVNLAPGAGGRLRLGMSLHRRVPSYRWPV